MNMYRITERPWVLISRPSRNLQRVSPGCPLKPSSPKWVQTAVFPPHVELSTLLKDSPALHYMLQMNPYPYLCTHRKFSKSCRVYCSSHLLCTPPRSSLDMWISASTLVINRRAQLIKPALQQLPQAVHSWVCVCVHVCLALWMNVIILPVRDANPVAEKRGNKYSPSESQIKKCRDF